VKLTKKMIVDSNRTHDFFYVNGVQKFLESKRESEKPVFECLERINRRFVCVAIFLLYRVSFWDRVLEEVM
jgi:hypothetical protein